MTANRDAANEVYTPIHTSRTTLQTALPESIPTVETDGVDCEGYNILAFTRTHSGGATTSQYELYVYDGATWSVVEDSSTLSATEYDPTATTFWQQYNVAGALRYRMRIVSADAGTIRSTENLQV